MLKGGIVKILAAYRAVPVLDVAVGVGFILRVVGGGSGGVVIYGMIELREGVGVLVGIGLVETDRGNIGDEARGITGRILLPCTEYLHVVAVQRYGLAASRAGIGISDSGRIIIVAPDPDAIAVLPVVAVSRDYRLVLGDLCIAVLIGEVLIALFAVPVLDVAALGTGDRNSSDMAELMLVRNSRCESLCRQCVCVVYGRHIDHAVLILEGLFYNDIAAGIVGG